MLDAWQPGRYELKTASGRTLRCEVPPLPQPLAISGPWDLRFPPHWGAPEKVTLENLISWTEHGDPGVKYFSGTATYTKTFTIAPDMLAKDRRLYLDLGNVQVIAEMTLNGVFADRPARPAGLNAGHAGLPIGKNIGKNLGMLWKPPFCVDITDIAKPGENALEIKVTNLWPNRLIGDEQLTDDCEWGNPSRLGGAPLKEWPKWLLEGKPSPTGRLTFTTWKHWTKDSPLLESGLLGPVTLRMTVKISLLTGRGQP